MIESGGITKMAASLPNLNQIPGPFLFVPPLHTGLCSICRQPPGNDSVAIWSSEKNENKEVGTLLWKYAGLKVSKDQGPGILCKLCLSRLKEIQKKVDQFRKGQFTGKAKQNLHLPEPGEPEDEETQIVRRDLIGVLETMCSKSFKYKKYVSVTGHIKFEVDGKTHTNIFLKEKYSRKMKYERPYKCDTCGRSFRLRNSLLGHEKAHQTAKLEYGDVMKGDLYVCQICNKTFTTRKYWKRHLNIHTEMGKRYQCQFCEKAFQTRSVRAKHELTHSGAKPFECHICGKKMTQKSTLKTHLLTHTEQKPFRCHLCGKGCVKMYELECHLRMHTGDRPFRCSICDKGFVRNYQLQQHIKQSGHENSMQTAVVLQTASTDDVKDVSTESIDEAAVCHLQHIIQLPGTGQNENISQTQLQPGQENIQPHIEQIQQQTDSVQNQMEYNVYNIGSQNQGTATPLNAQPLQGQAVAVTSDEGTFYVLVDSTSTGTGPTVACVQNIVNHKGNENIHN